MTSGFSRVRRGGAHAQLDLAEATLLASLAGQVVELLRDGAPGAGSAEVEDDPLARLVGIDGPVAPPDDPVVARLLPDAYTEPEDADAGADFRRYTERGLRDGKVANAEAVIAALREGGMETPDVAGDPDRLIDVELDAAGVDAWLRCLTDLRLAVGTRLGVEQDDEARWAAVPADDPAAAMHEVYEWLGFVQETLVRSLR